MLYPWGTTKPYNAYIDFLKKKFGGRLQKVSVNAGFTCPNRDGSKGFGGCTYCNNDSFVPPYC
ncbi:MAG: TIGR01212 family radical SAM protein, partial [Methanobacteriota archaeon]